MVLGDGQALVVKHVRDGGDWIMRASHDHGRAAELWSSGVLTQVPEVVATPSSGPSRPPTAGWWSCRRAGARRPLAPEPFAATLSGFGSTLVQGDLNLGFAGDRDEDALRLALLGGLIQPGWDKALHASGHPDPAVRAREAAHLAW